MESNQGSQVACSLGPSELSQRGTRWTALMARADAQVTPTESGMRLTFAAGQGIFGELRELVGLERQCCAFATWSVHENGGQLVVDIGANTAEGIAAVQAMFTG
jgi:MerR family transcriptional regulator, copper efflux regulator